MINIKKTAILLVAALAFTTGTAHAYGSTSPKQIDDCFALPGNQHKIFYTDGTTSIGNGPCPTVTTNPGNNDNNVCREANLLWAKIDKILGENANLSKQKQALEAQIAKLKSDHFKQNKQNAENRARLTALINQINTQITALEGELETLQKNKKKNAAQITATKNMITAKKAQLKQAQAELLNIPADVAMPKNLADKIKELESQIAELQKKITANTKEVDSIKNTLKKVYPNCPKP